MLRDAYRRSRAQATTVLVSGEAGIGKSRLVGSVLQELPGEPLVLTGGCLEFGTTGLPFGPIAGVLRSLLRQAGPMGARSVLGDRLTSWLEGGDTDAIGDRGRLLRELVALVERLATERPTVLLIEDLHWADEASRDLFVHLARNLGRAGLLLIGTVRTGELVVRHPLRQLLGELGRRAEVTTVDLGPLSRREVGDLVAARGNGAVSPAVAAAIHRRSGGNPLFVEALSDSDGSAGGLPALLLERVARLPDAAREVLGAIAVAGSRVSDTVLATVVDLSPDDLAGAVRVLVDRGQLDVVGGNGYRFRHDLIREAVYGDLLPGERRRLHRRYAETLARTRDPGDLDLVAELARHWSIADEPEQALTAAWQTALLARDRTAFDEALRQLEVVLSLWSKVADPGGLIGRDRGEVLELAGAAAFEAGDNDAGLRHVHAALAALDPGREPRRYALLLGRRARLESRANAGGAESITEALALVPAGQDDAVRARLLGDALMVLVLDDDLVRLAAVCAESQVLGEARADHLLLARAHIARAYRPELRSAGTAEENYGEAVRLARLAGDDPALLTAWQYLSIELSWQGRDHEALGVLAEAAEHAEATGLRRSRGSMLTVVACDPLLRLGRWDEALDLLEEALADSPPPLFRASLQFYQAWILVARGEWAVPRTSLPELYAIAATGWPAFKMQSAAYAVGLDLAVAAADFDEAGRLIDRLLAADDEYRRETPAVPLLVLSGLRALRAARGAAPRNQAVAVRTAYRRQRVLAMLERWPGRGPMEAAYRLAIAAETGPGQLADWDAAVEGWRAIGDVQQIAVTLVTAAEVALRSSNRSGAATRLRQAQELAERLGAAPLLTRIEELGARARLSPGTERAQRPGHGLTARELVVLRVLAQGRSNREIAAELFVSPNTVAHHVKSIFAKLAVNSRAEATALAHRSGLLDS
ncbi:regulatory LuxR family protein [Kribbella amoyensis]|uniref:Regulatory LuxR family protein n=1 Tax=Kribbella amoyensis TaxID=996641 RepID=A0A561B2E5_9ACTN|nr:regulatory LuxR family protein [Kribbella amoyensis]